MRRVLLLLSLLLSSQHFTQAQEFPVHCYILGSGTEFLSGDFFSKVIFHNPEAPFPDRSQFKVWLMNDYDWVIVGIEFWQREPGWDRMWLARDAQHGLSEEFTLNLDRITTVVIRSGGIQNGTRGNLYYRVEVCIPENVFIDPDFDLDFDGVPNHRDNCLWTANPDQQRVLSDRIGDACNNDFYQSFGKIRAYLYPDQQMSVFEDCQFRECPILATFDSRNLPIMPDGYSVKSPVSYGGFVRIYYLGMEDEVRVFQVNAYGRDGQLLDDHLQILNHPDGRATWRGDPNR